jgi:hypothetical protein
VRIGPHHPLNGIRDHDKALLTVDFTEILSRYALTLMCPQNRTEAILISKRQQGGDVVRPAQATAIRIGPAGVEADVLANGAHAW